MTTQPDPNTEGRDWIEQLLDDFYDGVYIDELPKAKAQIQKRLAEVEVTARLSELEGIARVYNSLPELHVARENACIALFARIRQLTQQRDSGVKT